MKTDRSFKPILVSVMILGLFSCVNIPRVETPVPFTELAQQAQGFPEQPYRIQRGDVIDIKFFYNPELNESLPVRPDGSISLPLIKEVKVVDLTPMELSELLKQKYSEELRKPEITINIKTFAALKVFVDGEVQRKGLLAFTTPMTVMEAITQSGGFTMYALMEEVVVIRRPPGQKPKATVVDMRKYLSAADFSQDINLIPYDIVFVPRTHIGDINIWIEQYITQLIPFGNSASSFSSGSFAY